MWVFVGRPGGFRFFCSPPVAIEILCVCFFFFLFFFFFFLLVHLFFLRFFLRVRCVLRKSGPARLGETAKINIFLLFLFLGRWTCCFPAFTSLPTSSPVALTPLFALHCWLLHTRSRAFFSPSLPLRLSLPRSPLSSPRSSLTCVHSLSFCLHQL